MLAHLNKVSFLIILAMLFGAPCLAEPLFVAGPFQDFKNFAPTDGTFITLVDNGPNRPFGADNTHFTVTAANTPVVGLAYISTSLPLPSADFLRMTTIYGFDLNPTGSAFNVTGFNPLAPEIISDSHEHFFGQSGAIYTSDFSAVARLSELPLLLPGFDLSPFHGDPGSIVYLFGTSIPASDAFLVPEPGTLAYFILGGCLLMGPFLRHRYASNWDASLQT